MTDELKKCPFCQMSDIYEISEPDNIGGQRPALFCNNCKAIVYFEDSTSKCESDDFEILQKILYKKWNRRTI